MAKKETAWDVVWSSGMMGMTLDPEEQGVLEEFSDKQFVYMYSQIIMWLEAFEAEHKKRRLDD